MASSWRNEFQPSVVKYLRELDHNVYDFKYPTEDDIGFSWKQIDTKWESWTSKEYIKALNHPLAVKGFANDMQALDECDAVVLVMPCGRSAHLELGYGIGKGKYSIIYTTIAEPELMYKMVHSIVTTLDGIGVSLGMAEENMYGTYNR